MSKGSFTQFEDALRAFESGVNPSTLGSGWAINNNVITQANLDRYNSGQISLTELQYTSVNFLGFIGYQVGEALMIDLGYYNDSFYYGNGAGTNTWDGTFTGKGGVNSLADLKTGLQEGVMLDAFALNLQYLNNYFAWNTQGGSLDQYIGRTMTFHDANDASITYTSTITMTGVLAAAHLRGAYGVFQLLHNGLVSADETGTSILTYMDKFGGYDSLSAATLIDARTNGTTLKLAETTWNADFNRDGKIGDNAGTQPTPTPTPTPGPTPSPEPTDDAPNTFHGEAGNQTFRGTAGASDTVDYSDASRGVTVDLAKKGFQAVSADQGSDKFVSIENLIGSNKADSLTGNADANAINGGRGNDVVNGAGGNDRLNGGAGNDRLDGGAGRDRLDGDAGNDRIDGGAGRDVLTGDTGDDTFVFVKGQASGDRVIDWKGAGGLDADHLEFSGYGAGATLTNIDATHWQINYDGGASHEVITLDSGYWVNSSDFHFV